MKKKIIYTCVFGLLVLYMIFKFILFCSTMNWTIIRDYIEVATYDNQIDESQLSGDILVAYNDFKLYHPSTGKTDILQNSETYNSAKFNDTKDKILLTPTYCYKGEPALIEYKIKEK